MPKKTGISLKDYSTVRDSVTGKQLGFLSGEVSRPPRKRLFIGLVTGTAVLLCLFLLAGWVIPYIGFGNIHPYVPVITGILLVLSIFGVAAASVALVIQSMTGKQFFGAKRLHGMTIRIFLPVMELLGRAIGFSQEEVRRSFIKVNNQMALSTAGKYKPSDVLILLPHCIQKDTCSVRVSHKLSACKRCGQCPIDGLIAIKEKYGVALAIATGGSIARRIVVEQRPKLIVAVACERDLASGIQDTHPLTVFGVLNSRPEGPCRNTVVTHKLIEDALGEFINPEYLPPHPVAEGLEKTDHMNVAQPANRTIKESYNEA